MNNEELEGKALYRLIRVAYYIALIIGEGFLILTFFFSSGESGSLYIPFIGVGLYMLLNLIKDALNYILFGKPLTFDWLKMFR